MKNIGRTEKRFELPLHIEIENENNSVITRRTEDEKAKTLMFPNDVRAYGAFLLPKYAASITTAQKVEPCPIRLPRQPAISRWKMSDMLRSRVTSDFRIACLCQYNGAEFSGWERKPATKTVQNTIEQAISAICGTSVRTFAASKTDAGTHAVGQVFHFDPPPTFNSSRAWIRAINSRLPNDIHIVEADYVPQSFHARRSATWRRYRYTILTSSQNSVFLSPFVWHVYQRPLNAALMHAAAQKLRCRHPKDFSAFRKARSPASHCNIVLYNISVHRASGDSNLVEIEVCASWFVYGMMRLLAAALVDVGSGILTVEEFDMIFRFGMRHRIRSSAPPNGLCLLEVGYPSKQKPFMNSKLVRQSSHVTLGLSPYHSNRSMLWDDPNPV